MATLRETVTASLQEHGYGSYLHYAQPTVEALEARERAIFTDLMAAGVELGASRQQVADVLIDAGLTEPRLTAVVSNGATLSGDERTELTSIRHDLSTLMERIDGVLG
jgi:hypothetical protein